MSVNITPKPKYVKGSATLENGSLIDLKQKYLLIVDEFMIKDDGGDDFACVLL